VLVRRYRDIGSRGIELERGLRFGTRWIVYFVSSDDFEEKSKGHIRLKTASSDCLGREGLRVDSRC
jgi:hypothetical protein